MRERGCTSLFRVTISSQPRAVILGMGFVCLYIIIFFPWPCLRLSEHRSKLHHQSFQTLVAKGQTKTHPKSPTNPNSAVPRAAMIRCPPDEEPEPKVLALMVVAGGRFDV